MLYFAYGSNMSSRRLQARIAAARFLTVAVLASHRLSFHKAGRLDGSGKCTIVAADAAEICVMGVVYDISAIDKDVLDQVEGLHHGYEEKVVTLTTPTGDILIASTYYATATDTSLKPFHWYKQHLLVGALEHGLPDHYVNVIRAVHSVADTDARRHKRELAIYR